MIPGELFLLEEPVELFSGQDLLPLSVINIGDRPIQVGSHYHFAEANSSLDFDRESAWGFRLAVPAGTAVRFEPGIGRRVELVALRGKRTVPGLRGLAAGSLDAPRSPDRRNPSHIRATEVGNAR